MNLRNLLIVAAGCLCSVVTAQERPLIWNLENSIQPLFQNLESETEDGKMLLIGDSILFKNDSIHHFLRNHFWRTYENGGDGYFGVSNGHRHKNWEEFSDAALFNGTWIVGNSGSNLRRANVSGTRLEDVFGNPFSEGVYAPDGITCLFSGNSQWETTVEANSITVHYITGPELSEFNVVLNGNIVTTIDTQSLELEHQTFTFVAPSNQLNDIILDPVNETEWVQINGLEYSRPENGYVQYRNSRGGAGPFDFNLSNNDLVRSQIMSYEVDTYLIMLDWSAPTGGSQADYYDNMNSLLDFYETTGTWVDLPFILVSHHPFKPSIEEEADILYQIAQERDLGYINLYDLFADYDEMNNLGFMADSVHFTESGGSWFANYIFDRLYQENCLGDWNQDGIVNTLDFLAYMNDYNAGEVLSEHNAS